MPFGLIALEEHLLAEVVGGEGDALRIVKGAQEGVRRLGDDVEGDAHDDVVLHVFAAVGD